MGNMFLNVCQQAACRAPNLPQQPTSLPRCRQTIGGLQHHVPEGLMKRLNPEWLCEIPGSAML